MTDLVLRLRAFYRRTTEDDSQNVASLMAWEAADEIARLRAALAEPAQQERAEPNAGWQMVPKEPTWAMEMRGHEAGEAADWDDSAMRAIYRAMLSAAPEEPKP